MANPTLNSLELKSLIDQYSSELNKLRFRVQLTQNTIADLKSDLQTASTRETDQQKAQLEQLSNGSSSSKSKPAKKTPAKTAKKTTAKSTAKTAEKSADKSAEKTADKADDKPAGKRRGRPRIGAGKGKAARAKKTETADTGSQETAAATDSKDNANGQDNQPATKKKATAKAKATPKKPTKKAPAKKKKGTRARSATGYRPSEYDLLVMESLDEKGQILIASEMQDYIKDKFEKEGRNTDEEEIKVMVTRSLQKLANRREDLKKVKYEGRGFAYAQPKWVTAQGDVKKKYQRT